MKRDYVAVIYDRQARPVTKYPDQLAEYLCHRFSIARKVNSSTSVSGGGTFARVRPPRFGGRGCGPEHRSARRLR